MDDLVNQKKEQAIKSNGDVPTVFKIIQNILEEIDYNKEINDDIEDSNIADDPIITMTTRLGCFYVTATLS